MIFYTLFAQLRITIGRTLTAVYANRPFRSEGKVGNLLAGTGQAGGLQSADGVVYWQKYETSQTLRPVFNFHSEHSV
jgi:hypothetical protein